MNGKLKVLLAEKDSEFGESCAQALMQSGFHVIQVEKNGDAVLPLSGCGNHGRVHASEGCARCHQGHA